MPFDLNAFRNRFVGGGARPSQFEMRITWPQQIASGLAAAADLPFLCNAARIPNSQVAPVEVPYFGRKLHFAGDRQVEPFSITVLNDEDFKIRKAIEAWMEGISGHGVTTSIFRGGLTSDSYATQAEVRQYSHTEGGQGGVPTHAYRFIGLWPSNLSEIELNWDQQGIETFTVQFQYQWWESIDAATGATISTTL